MAMITTFQLYLFEEIHDFCDVSIFTSLLNSENVNLQKIDTFKLAKSIIAFTRNSDFARTRDCECLVLVKIGMISSRS